MKKIKILYFIIAILIGVFMFIYGEIDDSPGGQLIGLLAVIMCIVGVIKKKSKTLFRLLKNKSAE